MRTTTAIIERSKDNLFSVYTNEYCFIGFGNTAHEAIDDFYLAYKEFQEFDEYKNIPKDLSFIFVYDTSSFLQLFKDRIGLANLQAITGINRRQLHHYASGVSRPSKKTVQRIQEGIKKYGEELCKVQLI
ncbi:MAG: hypothetical protein MJ000_09075 [Bacteroidales bacterium]|nr:hypothetical protein [Bacteroidales bacterium]